MPDLDASAQAAKAVASATQDQTGLWAAVVALLGTLGAWLKSPKGLLQLKTRVSNLEKTAVTGDNFRDFQDSFFKRLDEKHDALDQKMDARFTAMSSRIDGLVDRGGGGRL